MPKKKGLEYENMKPGIAHNTILSNELYGWKKHNCLKRHHDEWLDKRKAFAENKRPNQDSDDGWERKCFDFFEPFYLAGCIETQRRGQTYNKSGSQVDILFFFKALEDTFSSSVEFMAVCEAKNQENLDKAYESALNQLYSREFELKKTELNVQFLPIIFLHGDRRAVKDPADFHLDEIHKRTRKVWENDIDFYISQAIELGWRKTWKLFLLEVLGVRDGTGDIIDLPAIRYQIKGKTAYSAFLPASLALDICHVERAHKKAPHGVYQRPLDMTRLREIAEDLKDEKSLNTCFPNSIVAALDTQIASKQKKLWCPSSPSDSASPNKQYEPGTLSMPVVYGLLKVIDGQHRVFAHDLLARDKLDSYGLPFTIMDGLLPRDEMVLFKSINTTSEEVNSNLVDIILYTMQDHETDRGIASSIVCELAFEDDEWVDMFGHLGTGISDFDKRKVGIKIKIDNLVQPLIRKKNDYDLIRDNYKGCLNPDCVPDPVAYGKEVLKEYYTLLKQRFIHTKNDFWLNYIRTRPGLRLSLILLSTWIRKKNLRGDCINRLKLESLVEQIFKGRGIIIDKFDDTKGSTRGDDFLKNISNKILK